MTQPTLTHLVRAGDHACLTFTDADERLDLVAAFVRDGLRAGHKVVCWTDAVAPTEFASGLADRAVRPGAALRRGQLLIVPVSESLLAETDATAASMVALLAAEVEAAGRQGYPALRVAADMAWATRPAVAANELVAFEHAAADLFTDDRLCLICQYDRDRFDAVTLAFVANAHAKTVAAQVYHDHPMLRICRQYSPPGVRMAGEIDYRHRDILEQALAESLRLDRNPHLNLAKLDFMDGSCAAAVVAAVLRLPASRRMTVVCRRAVAKVLDLVGAVSVPNLRVQQTNEQS